MEKRRKQWSMMVQGVYAGPDRRGCGGVFGKKQSQQDGEQSGDKVQHSSEGRLPKGWG